MKKDKKVENVDVDLDQKELTVTYGKYQKQAEEIIKDENKLKNLLKKAKNAIHKLKNLPFIGGVIEDYIDLMDMLAAYVKGEYKKLPVSSLIAAAGALLYVLSPIDLISDIIPVVGFLDDAAVIGIACNIARKDLNNFRTHRFEKETENIENWIIETFGKENIREQYLHALIVDDNGDIGALISYENEGNSPLVCNMYKGRIPLDEYYAPEIRNDFSNMFKTIFVDSSSEIKKGVDFIVYDEERFEENESKYLIVDELEF